MAYISRQVNPQDVIALLKKNHELDPGDNVGRVEVDFEEQSGGRQSVKVELTYMLTVDEVKRAARHLRPRAGGRLGCRGVRRVLSPSHRAASHHVRCGAFVSSV